MWTPGGEWVPVPYVDEHRAELLFRHKILTLLPDRGLISQDRIDLLMSWRHSGFSVHNRTTVYPADTEGMQKLACCLMRAPVFPTQIPPKLGNARLRDQARTRARR